jgi:Spy/CpxP family protein refolding chaperone
MFGKGGFGFAQQGFAPWEQFGGERGACGGRGRMGGKFGPMTFLKDLDLTDEQLLKIAELKGKTFGKMARSKIELMELKKGIFHELLQAQVDKQKVTAKAQEIKEHISGGVDHILEKMIALSETLTPAQKKRLHLNMIRKFLGLDDVAHEEE